MSTTTIVRYQWTKSAHFSSKHTFLWYAPQCKNGCRFVHLYNLDISSSCNSDMLCIVMCSKLFIHKMCFSYWYSMLSTCPQYGECIPTMHVLITGVIWLLSLVYASYYDIYHTFTYQVSNILLPRQQCMCKAWDDIWTLLEHIQRWDVCSCNVHSTLDWCSWCRTAGQQPSRESNLLNYWLKYSSLGWLLPSMCHGEKHLVLITTSTTSRQLCEETSLTVHTI